MNPSRTIVVAHCVAMIALATIACGRTVQAEEISPTFYVKGDVGHGLKQRYGDVGQPDPRSPRGRVAGNADTIRASGDGHRVGNNRRGGYPSTV